MKPFFQAAFNIMNRMQNAPQPMVNGQPPQSGSGGIQNNRQKPSSSESYSPGTPDATGVVTNQPPQGPPQGMMPPGSQPGQQVPWKTPSFDFTSLLGSMAGMMGGGSLGTPEQDFLARYQAAIAANPLPEIAPQSFQFQPMQNYFQGLPTQAVSPIQYPGIQDPTQRLMQDFLYRKSMLQ